MDLKEFMQHFENNTRLENGIWLENFALWESRKVYLQLIKKFLNQEITGIQLDRELYGIWYADSRKFYSFEEVFDKIKSEKLPEVESFATLLSDLRHGCNFFEPDDFLREDGELSEKDLMECAKKTFLELQTFLELEDGSS